MRVAQTLAELSRRLHQTLSEQQDVMNLLRARLAKVKAHEAEVARQAELARQARAREAAILKMQADSEKAMQMSIQQAMSAVQARLNQQQSATDTLQQQQQQQQSATDTLQQQQQQQSATDGWTFPLRTTQSAIKKGSQTASGAWVTWCFDSRVSCHHDYNAADIMAITGTPVLAPVAGTVVSTHEAPSNECIRSHDGHGYDENHGGMISIKGEDGKAYFMGHFLMGSLKVKAGDKVTSGQEIAAVGTIGTAQCTVPHLHIQQNPAGDYGGQDNSYNIQPALVKLFKMLPA